MLIIVAAVVVALAVAAVLTFAPFARAESWHATVTPLASIIGSGFLISGPLLAHEFGAAALAAMAVLLAIAYAVGAVIRFNIVHVEAFTREARFNSRVMWLARVTQVVLALAYAVSVAYYLKLLAEFGFKMIPVPPAWHTVATNSAVTGLIALLTLLAFSGDLRRIERVAHGTVAIKLGVIAGLLAAVGLWWAAHAGRTDPVPAARLSLHSVPMLLGLLITVQGFETSRYLGHAYPAEMRIRTMRNAQWIAAGVYLAFLALLTPLLGRASHAEGVAGIIDVMALVAPGMAILVLVGAASSQLSAAVADSIGAGGLMNEVSGRRLPVPVAFALANLLAVAVVWLTDPFQVVAVSSRAFAVFYLLQCVLALLVSRHDPKVGLAHRLGFIAVGLVCSVAAILGAPAE